MTNGTVSAEKGGAAGLTLTVTYDGGSKSFRISVPPTAPTLRGGRPVGSRHRLQRFHQNQPWQPGRPYRRRQGRYATHVRLPRHPLLQKTETWLPAAKRRRTNQEKFMSQNISLPKALLKVEASPSAPRLSSAQLLDAPENKAIQDIWALPPDNPRLHAGSKIAVLATDGVEEIEMFCIISARAEHRLTWSHQGSHVTERLWASSFPRSAKRTS
jgi:hypothetical protein